MCVCVCVWGGGGGEGVVIRGLQAGEHYGIVLTVMIACEQALRGALAVGGKRKESLQLQLYVLQF